MITNRQNSHLHSKSQLVPQMPFSSPTAEEILSPVLSNLSHNSPQLWRKNRDDRAGRENTHSRTKSSLQKPPKREASRRQARNQNKYRWPGLNVVTNFSKSPILAHRAADAATQHNRKKESRAQNVKPGFVTLSDVKPPIDNKGDRGFKTHRRNKSSGGTLRSDLELRNHDEKPEKSIYSPKEETTGLGLQHYGDPPDYDACLLSDSMDRLNRLKPSPTKITELSPSDGPIVIGISIPSAKLAEHAISPDAGPTPLTSREYTTHRDAPPTPTIIVTPARDDEPWSTAFGDRNEVTSSRRRVASSIYSRATHYGQGWTPPADIPPVPVRPQEYVSAKPNNSKNLPDDHVRGLGPRVDSNDTIFDEDNQVTTSNINRSTSGESQPQILQPPRINTAGRRHASQGWWNYVLSPFTARSNTMMFRGDSPKSAGSIPTSSPKSETATSHGQPEQLPAQFSSPVIGESIGTRIDRTSLRTDYSRFENERHNTGLVFDHTPSTGGPSAFNSPTSFDGFGAAAEYYNACWHDQNSPTPYFECQNHSCSSSARENFPAPDDPVKDIEDSDVVRDLADNKSNGRGPHGFHQTPTNRFSAAFGQANRSKPRPLSEATDIEDLDETPVVREAYVAPVVHAGAPITAASVAGASTTASPMVSSLANAPNTTILNTITLNNHYAHTAPTKDAVSPSTAQPSWIGPVNQPLSSSAASEQPREMVGSPQPTQSSSVQQPATYAASSPRAHKKFVAVMPPDQASSTREAPISSTPSLSSEPLYPKHSLPFGSALSSSQAPSNFGAPEFPGTSGPSKNYLFPESSSPAHPDHAASRPPILYEPPATSRNEESSNTGPSGYAVSEATPASSYANSGPLLSSELMSSSGVPESSNFVATKVSPPSSITNSKMPPSSNAELSSKYTNSRDVTSSEPPMTSGNINSRSLLPFDASSSSQPSRPSRPPLSSQPPLSPSTSYSSQHPLSPQLPTSSHPELSYATPLPQKPPVSSQPPFSYNTPTEIVPSSSYAYSRVPPSEYQMSPGHTSSGTLPSNYAASRAPPSELSTSSAPPLSTEYTAPRQNASGPLSSTNATSRAPVSFEVPIASQSLMSSHTTISDPPASSQAAASTLPISSRPLLPKNVTSRGLPPAEPMSSEFPSSSGYMASAPAPSSEPPISSGPLMSSRYATPEPRPSDFTKSKAPPAVEPNSLGPLFSSNNAASDAPPSSAALSSSRNMTSGPQPMTLRTPSVAKLMRSEPPFASNYVESSVPPSSEPPLSSRDATSRDETAEFPLSSDYTSSRTLPFEPQTSSGPEIFSGPQFFENGSSASQARNFPRKAVPRNENLEDQTRSAPHTYVVNNYYDGSGSLRKGEQIPLEAVDPPLDSGGRGGNSWEIREKHYHRSPKRKARCYPSGKCFNRDKGRKSHMTKTKKRLLWVIAVSLVILIILILALIMTLTRKGDKLNVQSQWLNITGFPPIPTGISTIVQPDAVHETSSCVQPATMWSCAVPKEEQQSISPNDPDQPNFRIEIRFQNGTTSNSTSNTKNPSKRSQVPAFNPISATTSIRRRLLHVRDAFNSNLFSPSPSPPSEEDQVFLGNSTDKITAPFNGESTPFFISFLSASKLPQRRLLKRQRSQTGNITDPFPNLTEGIPPPDTNSDGTAASANLLPFPTAQPLRLYDRGLLTEHYGFYNYFDRSIFLKSTSLLNDTGPTTGDVPDDEDGGAEQSSATVRCTWRETRFLVQIWTNQAAASPLLGFANHTASGKNQPPKNLTESTANDFVRPGSFPYPVTITLDRHGGDPDNKFIYCYGMDARGHIILDEKKIQLEDRASGGGVLVNPAQGLFSDANDTKAEGGPGGIDGGTGGCGCQWSNFGSA